MRYRHPACWTGSIVLVVTRVLFLPTLEKGAIIGFFAAVVSLTLVPAGVLLLLLLVSQLRRGNGLIYRATTFISVISYSMYLLHFTVIQRMLVPWISGLLVDVVHGNALVLVKYTLYWGLCILLPALMYSYFEYPTTQLRERLKR